MSLDAAYLFCQKLTQTHSKSFYWASYFLPLLERKAIYSLYSFCRYTDNLVDEAHPSQSVDQTIAQLEDWKNKVVDSLDLAKTIESRAELLNIFTDKKSSLNDSEYNILLSLTDVFSKYPIDNKLPLEIIRGVAMDLQKNRYNTIAELREYCYLVASVVGIMVCPILGSSEPQALIGAEKLGIAMQITNILRDIGEDYEMNRIYLPQESLEQFGYLEAEFPKKTVNLNFRNMLDFYIKLAKQNYVEAKSTIKYLSPRMRFPIRLAANLYAGILDKIVVNDYQVYQKRASLNSLEKMIIVLKSLFG